MRKVEPLPIPVVINNSMNMTRKPQKFPEFPSAGIKYYTPNTAAIMITKFHKVACVRPSQPPTGLIKAPTSGPKKAYWVGLTSENKILISMGRGRLAKPDEKNERYREICVYYQTGVFLQGCSA